MNSTAFNALDFHEQLVLINSYGREIDNIFPWTGNLRIVKLYKLNDFLVELECDLTKNNQGLTYAHGFNSLNYVFDKYPHHFYNDHWNAINKLIS